MSDLAISSVLAQIRSLQAQSGLRTPPGATQPVGKAPGAEFASLLKQGLEKVSEAQATARGLQEAFAAGDSRVELSDVMLASAQAQVGFRATVEVRNRLVSAYQDIMNLPL